MLLSEADARDRWCPFARVTRRESLDPRGEAGGIVLAHGTNRDALGRVENPASCRCYASSCMAWRWAGWRTSWGTVATAPAMQDRNGPPLGFCGLSGKPEALVDQPDHSASKPKEQP
ncbi:hypothetical protein [Methylobacterium fujisawaense]|uniref:hypothetical protein n=1 Tax=Methylobacterium fujisawaense TaxID=107400 RepID=UPI002F35DC83